MQSEPINKLLFLGTGASAGIPAIGCSCAVCRSNEKRNKRLRASVLVKIGDKTLLIDAGPDLRQQALQYKIDHIDGVLFTHTHFDHTGGIDDLRGYCFKTKQHMLCLASEESLADLQKRFYYLFDERPTNSSTTVKLSFQVLQGLTGTTDFLGIKIGYVTYYQGGMGVNGFRFGDLAYLTDIRDYDESIFDALQGVKILIISALRNSPSQLHFTISEASAFAHKLGAEMTWLTHIAHDLDYAPTNAQLSPHIQLAYDGLIISF